MIPKVPFPSRVFGAAIAICGTWVGLWGFPSTADAELTVVEEHSDEGSLTIYRLTVTPAPEPAPPLRHRLAVREIDLKPGNAATHYLRAFPESGFESQVKRMVDTYGEAFHDWSSAGTIPLSEFPLEKAREAAASFDGVVDHFIAPATIRRDCDWGLGIEEMRGPEIVQFLLPEINASRSVSRILALRARVALAEGDYDRALEQLRMNYRLAQNVGSEPLLVCALVGIAEASIGQQQVIDMIGAPHSPNLYWALAELPQPLVDVCKAVQFEMSLGVRIFPFLSDAETADHSPEEWARLLATAWSGARTYRLAAARQWRAKGMESGRRDRLVTAGLSCAKQRLLDAGTAPDQIDAMPVGQVIAIDAAREYRRVADEAEKWMYVPYYIARQQEPESPFTEHGLAAASRGYGYVLATLLLPAVTAARSAEARLEWQTRALQVVEALRMHAAQTGKLPASLNDVKVVPVPLNPATNEPYQYRLNGSTGVLDLPFSDGFRGGVAWRFEITLVDGN